MRNEGLKCLRLTTRFVASLVVSVAATASLANAASVVNIQLVGICLDNGTGCSAATFDTNAIKTFWQNEAGLTINFLSPGRLTTRRSRPSIHPPRYRLSCLPIRAPTLLVRPALSPAR